MEIDRNGRVTVQPQDAGTFKDASLPLEDRVDMLGILLGGDEQYGFPAEVMLKDAALRLRSIRRDDSKRVAAMAQAAERINQQAAEIHRLAEDYAGLSRSYTADVYELQQEARVLQAAVERKQHEA